MRTWMLPNTDGRPCWMHASRRLRLRIRSMRPTDARVAALQKAGIYESVKAKLVYGENIRKRRSFVQSGNAQAGIVAMSLRFRRDAGWKRWDIPAEMHPAIEQGAIVLKDAKNKEAARVFLEFVEEFGRARHIGKVWFAFPEKRGKKKKDDAETPRLRGK